MAACAEGCGSPEFTAFLREGLTDAEYLERITEAPVVVDQWQLEKLALVTRQMDVLFYAPGLSADFYPMLWGKAYESPGAALAALLDGLPAGAEVAVIPEGPYVLAKADQGAGHAG